MNCWRYVFCVFPEKIDLGETCDELLGDACYPFAKYMFIVFFLHSSHISLLIIFLIDLVKFKMI